jgi:hypothetical protein
VASKVLKARISIDEFQTTVMDKHQLQDYIERNLFAQMSSNIIDEMTIEKDSNPNVGTSTYTGTLHVGANSLTGSSYHSTIRNIETPLNLRVVEFTKKNKVTKVELQYYIEGNWLRVPRIQIEEK